MKGDREREVPVAAPLIGRVRAPYMVDLLKQREHELQLYDLQSKRQLAMTESNGTTLSPLNFDIVVISPLIERQFLIRGRAGILHFPLRPIQLEK